jgi:hypothetical protein
MKQDGGYAFTECEVAADGAVTLGFVDSNGNKAMVRLTVNQVGALAMTLPELIAKALRNRYGDQTLRYAYPLTSWTVEQSTDPKTGMMTLGTEDGFSVCFSMGREIQTQLGQALASERLTGASTLAN